MIAGRHKIAELRERLANRFPELRTRLEEASAQDISHWPTGIPKLDRLLHGGLPQDCLTELVVVPQAGGTLILHALLRRARENLQWLALVDGMDSFDPSPFNETVLSHLLWIRCRQAKEALQSADLLARDNNFPVVLLDLRMNSPTELRKISATVWHRLQSVARNHRIALVALTSSPLVSAARCRLSVDGRFGLDDLFRDENDLLREQTLKVLKGAAWPGG